MRQCAGGWRGDRHGRNEGPILDPSTTMCRMENRRSIALQVEIGRIRQHETQGFSGIFGCIFLSPMRPEFSIRAHACVNSLEVQLDHNCSI